MVAKLLTKIWRQIINNKTLIIFKTLSSCSLTITFVTKIPFFFFLILFFLLSYTYTQRVLKKLQPHLASILMREGSAIWAKSLLARPRPLIFTFTKLLFSVFLSIHEFHFSFSKLQKVCFLSLNYKNVTLSLKTIFIHL